MRKLRDDSSRQIPSTVSPRLQELIYFLQRQDHNRCIGMLLTRLYAASILCTLLSKHSTTKDMFKYVTFDGEPNLAKKEAPSLGNILYRYAPRDTLLNLSLVVRH
jgi:hypothetical protein